MKCPIKAATIKIEDGCYVVTPTDTAADVLGLGRLEFDFANMTGAKIKQAELQAQLDAAYADAC